MTLAKLLTTFHSHDQSDYFGDPNLVDLMETWSLSPRSQALGKTMPKLSLANLLGQIWMRSFNMTKPPTEPESEGE